MSQALSASKISSGAASRWWSVRALDAAERGVILAFYVWLVFRLLAAPGDGVSLANLLLALSEGIVVVLVLLRRAAESISPRPVDWLCALAASTAPLFVQPLADRALIPAALGAAAMLSGVFVQVHAKLVLGRSFGCIPASRKLKFSGPYRYVRHPMYAGYLLTHLAFLLVNPGAWNLGTYLVCYAFQVPRLLAEERLLGQEPHYAEYMRRVRYRLIPRIF